MEAMEAKEAARKARNAYARQWRKKNPERVKQINERYWLKKYQEWTEQDESGGVIDASAND